MLATDLDGTFIGDDAAMMDLWAELSGAGIQVVFSTGRHLPSIQEFYARHGIERRAAACICMVGSEIWTRDGSDYTRDESWSHHISAGWDRDAVAAILKQIPAAAPQAEEWQSDFKASYFLEEPASAHLQTIADELNDRGLNAKIVYSAGRFLDLLPQRSGKGGAVSWVARSQGIAAGDVITAGDTGNDLDMMRPELGFRSIAVGNAADELRTAVEPNIYHAEANFAAGIREGLARYGWLTPMPRGGEEAR